MELEPEPEPEPGTAEEQLLRALRELSRAGRAILAGAKADSCGGGGAAAAAVEVLQEFVSRKIGRMAGMIHLYANFLNSLHVHKRSEAEDLWETFYHSASVRDYVEDLMQFELEWNNFLSEVDARLKTNCLHVQLKLGTQVPMHMTFTDVRSGREVRFEEILQHQKKLLLNQSSLDAVPLKVLVISFGCREGALQWLQETKCSYDMLLDPSRQLYHALGLGASVEKVWNVSVLTYYAEQIVCNRSLPRKMENIVDDPHQLGGDFGLNQNGTVIFFHPSSNPTDRPDISEILLAMQ
ncbi:hypothetical protein chiPu_0010199 [Chiloscyllium punctatum]|uniref:Selenoprotein L n=1 Tax=Chiloscyllium punctatum TaxID=137246 RepID=A0A401SMY9_CHIPU|nr:hypothetical protein [Chiloscyllium punctatum]